MGAFDMAEHQPLTLSYGCRANGPRRLLKALTRLFLFAAVLFGAMAGGRDVWRRSAVVRIRLNASRQRDAIYERLMHQKVAAETVVFDEAKDSLPVVCLPTSGAPYMIRFRGDQRAVPPPINSCRFRSQYSSLEALRFADGQAADGLNRVRCASGLYKAFVCGEVFGPPFTSYPGQGIDLFVHERQARGAKKRLVAICFDAYQFTVGDAKPLSICLYTPGGLLRSGHFDLKKSELGFACAPTEPLRLYAGQPDPNDESHFTISYMAGARHGVIDGWLTGDGDSVMLEAHGHIAAEDTTVTAPNAEMNQRFPGLE